MSPKQLAAYIASQTADDPQFAVNIVEALLATSAEAGASDLHLTPTVEGLSIQWRINGVLEPVANAPRSLAGNIITRLKVLAGLLTYQTAVPQEGRIAMEPARLAASGPAGAVEVRVSTFPTVFGEKIVTRNLPQGVQRLAKIGDLALPSDVEQELNAALRDTSGAVIVAGPAGSGKTTTGYACLREIIDASAGRRSISSLEDPVEAVVAGVAQSQVDERAGFDLLTALRSLVRQDPEVIYIGEIRDAATAAVALQASLTGQLVITTFHASDAATAISRLADMGAPPYAIRSGVTSVVAQRLVRRLCDCAEQTPAGEVDIALGVTAQNVRRPVGCDGCRGTGYAGRVAVAEVLRLAEPKVAEAVLRGDHAASLREAGVSAGMRPLRGRALNLVDRGATSSAEVVRVFGIAPSHAT